MGAVPGIAGVRAPGGRAPGGRVGGGLLLPGVIVKREMLLLALLSTASSTPLGSAASPVALEPTVTD